jgi:hypothetical protein
MGSVLISTIYLGIFAAPEEQWATGTEINHLSR